MNAETLIKLFNEIKSIDREFTETGEIELDNLDWATLVLNNNNQIVVENEHGTQFGLEELSESEMGLFEFELNNIKQDYIGIISNINLEEAKKAIDLCIEDIEMLIDGRWNPDEESAEATLDNLIKVKDFLKLIED
jgi:hypothetical protein